MSAQALLEDARAASAIARADVAMAEAQLEQARIEQSYTKVAAPFPGEISRAFYSEGALVGPAGVPLAHLVKTDPVRVVFSIPDTLLIELRGEEAAGQQTEVDFQIVLSNGELYPSEGELEYFANQADPATGTVPVRLIVDNPDRVLVPGQFVDVRVGPSEPPTMPVVPQRAVLQDRDGRYVFVVTDEGTVEQRRIEVGPQVGNEWAVADGLSEGERVVVQGLQRITDGMAVQVSETAAGSGN